MNVVGVMTAHDLDAELPAKRARLVPLRGGQPLDDNLVRSLFAVVAWSVLVEPGDSIAGRLVGALGPEAALRSVISWVHDDSLIDPGVLTRGEASAGLKRWAPRLVLGPVRAALDSAARAGVRLITPDDPAWPAALCDLGEHAPLCLWVRGDVSALRPPGPAVSLVGARAASAYGEHVAMEFASELSGRGVTVISGAAYGIDGAAHRATVLSGGTTVALLAGGADRAYPAGHSALLERIAETGAIVSEVPCGAAPTKWRFLARNRLIAALGGATVVVEAGWRSGSLNTAAHAATLGRPIGAVPGAITSAASAGCHRLLREFDARCVTSVNEVLELLGWDPSIVPGWTGLDGASAGANDLSGDIGSGAHDLIRVRDALSTRSWRSPRDIAQRSGLGIDRVEALLGVLGLDGGVERADGGWRAVSV